MAFKKVRVTKKKKVKRTKLDELFDKRKQAKVKLSQAEQECDPNICENIEDEIVLIETEIAKMCEEQNWQKIRENFAEVDGPDGNLQHQGIWKNKRKLFPKVGLSLPVAKKNSAGQLISNQSIIAIQ